MFYRRNWIAGIVAVLGLVMFVPVAQAQRQIIEGIGCHSNTNTVVQAIPGEIYVGTFEGKGIFRSTHESKWADNNTYYQVGVIKAAGGKWTWNGYSKNLRTDGDIVIWEFSGDSVSGTTSKVIYGTGKFKGAKGEMTSKQITAGKPVVEGTTQSCNKSEGWIELVK
jgi:hypothetical protein